MSYYRPRGDFFGDIWGGLTDVVSFAAPIVGAIAAPFTGGASLALGAGIGAAARAAHNIGRGGPQTAPPGATNPIPESTGYATQAVRAPRARRQRQPRQPRGRRGRRLRIARQAVIPDTSPPVVAPTIDAIATHAMARLSDPSGGTMTMPGTGIVIPSTDPSPILTYENIPAAPPELGGLGAVREQQL